MMSTSPPFLLTHDQARRLQTYIQTYRQYALTHHLPSVERNTLLRVLQVMQGKLIATMDQPASRFSLPVTKEEMTALRVAVTELLILFGKQPDSIEKIATLSDLVALKACLKISEA